MESIEIFLNYFSDIDKHTIDVLKQAGYDSKRKLLVLDLKEDLPKLPLKNLAQVSMLRYALKTLQRKNEINLIDFTSEDSQTKNGSLKRKMDSQAAKSMAIESYNQSGKRQKKNQDDKSLDPNGMSNPTPQMVEIMKKIEEEKNAFLKSRKRIPKV